MIKHKLACILFLILMSSLTLLPGCGSGSSMYSGLFGRPGADQQAADSANRPGAARDDMAKHSQTSDKGSADTSLIPLQGTESSGDMICDLDIYKDTLLVLSQTYEDQSSSSFPPYKLALYNASDGSLIKEKNLDGISGGLYLEADFTDDGSICLACEQKAMIWMLDTGLDLTDQASYTPADTVNQYREHMARNPFITGAYTLYPSAALYYSIPDSGSSLMAVTYYDDPEHLYIVENNPEPVIDSCGDLLLCCDDQVHNRSITVDLRNYKESLHLNSKQIPIPKEARDASINYTCLSEDYALLGITGGSDESMSSTVYLWKYKENAMNRELDSTCVTPEGLEERIDNKAEELTSQYGINFYYGRKIIDTDEYRYIKEKGLNWLIDQAVRSGYSDVSNTYNEAMVLEPDLLQVYYIMLNLDDYLQEFPPGYAKELYADYPDGSSPEHLDIFIMKEIPGDMSSFSAYAAIPDIKAPFLAVFATDEFYPYQIPKEFMRLMDSRIDSWLASQGRSLHEEWCSMNPADFTYSPDHEDMNGSYFCSADSLISEESDRSELFMSLYEARHDKIYPYWLPQDTPVKAKAVYLCDIIRQAFPSLKNQKSLPWEKWAVE